MPRRRDSTSRSHHRNHRPSPRKPNPSARRRDHSPRRDPIRDHSIRDHSIRDHSDYRSRSHDRYLPAFYSQAQAVLS